MKKARMLILVAVMVMALFAAVLPALAAPFEVEVYNWSFEGDKNGDNIPDKWNVKGDVFRVCDHAWRPYTYDNCMMVFPPSNSGAALWQILVRGGQDQPVWTVISTEGEYVPFMSLLWASKGLSMNRVYAGAQVMVSDGNVFTVYDAGPYGHNFWHVSYPAATVGSWALDYTEDDIVEVKFGILTLPGDGYFAVDWMTPFVP